MADRGGERGGDRGGRGRCERCGGRQQEEEKWVPVTKLGRLVLVKENKIHKIEDIYVHSLPVKEHQIIEQLVPGLKDEVMEITPVQKQSRTGQRTRFEAFVAPCKVTGKCGSVTVRMVPAPRGAGIVAASVPKKDLQFAGTEDVFTSSRGSTKTLGNFVTATFVCLMKTYGFLNPEFWTETKYVKTVEA